MRNSGSEREYFRLLLEWTNIGVKKRRRSIEVIKVVIEVIKVMIKVIDQSDKSNDKSNQSDNQINQDVRRVWEAQMITYRWVDKKR